MDKIYFELIKAGKRNIKQVPSNLLAVVKSLLDEAGIKY